jgi:hypothetical protein
MEIQCGYHGAMAAKKRKVAADGKMEESMRLRCTSTEKAVWTAAAERDGRDLSNWLRFLANREAGRSEK